MRGALAAPALRPRADAVGPGLPDADRPAQAAGRRRRGPGVRRVAARVHQRPRAGRPGPPHPERGHHVQRRLPAGLHGRSMFARGGRADARATIPIATFLSFFTAFSLLLASSLQFTGVADHRDGRGADAGADQADPGRRSRRPPAARPTPATCPGGSALSHVSFRYGEDGPLVLDDVTLSIEPGEFVAIVGPTGLRQVDGAAAAARLRDPDVGRRALRRPGPRRTRRLRGPPPVRGGAAERRAAGRQHQGQHRRQRASTPWTTPGRRAEMAGLDEDIRAMPMGMHTGAVRGDQHAVRRPAAADHDRPRAGRPGPASCSSTRPPARWTTRPRAVVAESTRQPQRHPGGDRAPAVHGGGRRPHRGARRAAGSSSRAPTTNCSPTRTACSPAWPAASSPDRRTPGPPAGPRARRACPGPARGRDRGRVLPGAASRRKPRPAPGRNRWPGW